jgi:hypothetical protein
VELKAPLVGTPLEVLETVFAQQARIARSLSIGNDLKEIIGVDNPQSVPQREQEEGNVSVMQLGRKGADGKRLLLPGRIAVKVDEVHHLPVVISILELQTKAQVGARVREKGKGKRRQGWNWDGASRWKWVVLKG